MTDVYANSGNPTDIQTAVNTCNSSGGGTVYIPSGTYYWNGETVTILGGVNVIGASPAGCQDHTTNWASYSATTILHNNDRPTVSHPVADMFHVDGSNNKQVRISGIQFENLGPATVPDENQVCVAISMYPCINARVDHCTFINFCNIAVYLANTATGTASAVVDHCVVNNPYKLTSSGWSWAYGFSLLGEYPSWDNNINHFLGLYPVQTGFPVLYVEDCHMSYCRHSVDATQGGWIVTRYCLLDHPYPENFGMLDVHGSGNGLSARGCEFYDNTVVCDSTNKGQPCWVRGGGGVVFDNSFTNVYSGAAAIQIYNEDGPAGTTVHNLWVWGNTADATMFSDTTGNYVQNVDYFLRAPNQAQDGFTYTNYTYPHPLVGPTPSEILGWNGSGTIKWS